MGLLFQSFKVLKKSLHSDFAHLGWRKSSLATRNNSAIYSNSFFHFWRHCAPRCMKWGWPQHWKPCEECKSLLLCSTWIHGIWTHPPNHQHDCCHNFIPNIFRFIFDDFFTTSTGRVQVQHYQNQNNTHVNDVMELHLLCNKTKIYKIWSYNWCTCPSRSIKELILFTFKLWFAWGNKIKFCILSK